MFLDFKTALDPMRDTTLFNGIVSSQNWIAEGLKHFDIMLCGDAMGLGPLVIRMTSSNRIALRISTRQRLTALPGNLLSTCGSFVSR